MVNTTNISSGIFENLYKTVRMSLLVGNVDNREEMINNLLDTALKLDAEAQKNYNSNLESKFYSTTTLEDEANKLEEIINYVNARVTARNGLVNDFKEVTGRTLEGLEEIKETDNLERYVLRLNNIKDYLNSFEIIKTTKLEIEQLNKELEKEKKLKIDSEQGNISLENKLVDVFKSCVSNIPDFKTIETLDVEFELTKIKDKVSEDRKTLDIFGKAYVSLKSSGISNNEVTEYENYVQGAKVVYYQSREKEILLTIYKIILNKETEYIKVFMKRDKLSTLLGERLTLRNELNIASVDAMAELYRVVKEQYVFVNAQKENIEKISSLSDKIKIKETKLENLEANNNRMEIRDLLNEYGIKHSTDYEISESLPIEDFKIPEVEYTAPKVESEEHQMTFGDNVKKSNEVTEVNGTNKIDFNNVFERAKTVMIRVAKMLDIDTEAKKVSVDTEILPESSQNEKISELSNIVAFPTGLPNTEVSSVQEEVTQPSIIPSVLPEEPIKNNIDNSLEAMQMPSMPSSNVIQFNPASTGVNNNISNNTYDSDLIFPSMANNNFTDNGVNYGTDGPVLRKAA